MDKTTITKLKNFYAALSNERRLRLVLLAANGGTVTELSRQLQLDYNMTSQYVNRLAREGLVQRTRNPDRTVTVKALVEISETGELKRIKSA